MPPAEPLPAPQVASRPAALDILVAEDEPALRALLVEYLQMQGYVVHAVANGVEALRHLHGHRPALLISDVCMPDFDGIELLTRLRKQQPAPAIIVISGGLPRSGSSPEGGTPAFLLKMARALGAQRTLAKPFALAELLACVREAIGPAR